MVSLEGGRGCPRWQWRSGIRWPANHEQPSGCSGSWSRSAWSVGSPTRASSSRDRASDAQCAGRRERASRCTCDGSGESYATVGLSWRVAAATACSVLDPALSCDRRNTSAVMAARTAEEVRCSGLQRAGGERPQCIFGSGLPRSSGSGSSPRCSLGPLGGLLCGSSHTASGSRRSIPMPSSRAHPCSTWQPPGFAVLPVAKRDRPPLPFEPSLHGATPSSALDPALC